MVKNLTIEQFRIAKEFDGNFFMYDNVKIGKEEADEYELANELMWSKESGFGITNDAVAILEDEILGEEKYVFRYKDYTKEFYLKDYEQVDKKGRRTLRLDKIASDLLKENVGARIRADRQ